MSTPPETAVRKGPNWILTTVGALIVFAIFILVNVLAGMTHSRFDMTANKVHTLTQGTKNILGRVDTNTTIRFFVSPKEMLPPQLQPFVDQTDSWLARFREVNPDHLIIEKKEVEPATDEQEMATAAKIEPRQNVFYFALSVSCLDNTSNIEWVPDVLSTDGKEDDRIEYNLVKAISEVTRSKKKKVGLMSALPVEASFGSRDWTFVSDLKSQYEVKSVKIDTTSIEDGIDVLVVIHPAGITDEAQFAIDQYLLKGGRVVAFLDPNSFMAQLSKQNQNPMMAQMGQGGVETSSTFNKLLDKWGYTFDTTKIVADPAFGMPIGQNLVDPVLLSIGANGIRDKQDELVKDLTSFFCIYSGGFAGTPASGLSETIYLETSPKHDMVGQEYALANPTGPEAQKKSEELRYKIKPQGKTRILAMRLMGKFKTAFPDGKPAPPPPKPPGGPGGGFPGGGFPGGFPGGGLPGGDQGAQGPEGQPAPPATPAAPPATPATPPAATPATPAPPKPAPATPPVTATTPPVSATTPPVTIDPNAPPANPATPATPPATGAPKPATPASATTPPITITPGAPPAPAPAPLPVTPAKTDPPLLPPAAGVAKPADPGSWLKEGEKDGVVYLVADSDMIADLQPTVQSHNFALALGMVDQASGDRDLLEVRSRGAAMRPFSTLKEIMEQAQDRIRKEVESMQSEVQKINEDITSKKNAKDRTNAWVQGMRDMQAKELAMRKTIYQKQKEAKKEYEDVVFAYKWKNVFIPPVLVALVGIGVFITRKIRTAAH